MYHIKDHKTIDMFDLFAHLGQKRRGLLDSTWAKLFRDEILPVLPVHLLKEHYDPINGRPTKELYAMMGAMILQQMQDLTDQQAVEQFSFNTMWHFALNITNPSDECSYVCERSIWSMRHIMTEKNLYQPIFSNISDHLGRLLKIDTSLQRLDSVHIFSNMRHLGRIRIFATTIRKFLTNLKRHHKVLFDRLPEELTERYLSKRAESAFAMVKPSESSRTLDELGKDLFALVERFRANGAVANMTSYQLLVRVLSEQCVVEEDKETKTRKVRVKPNREVPSDSLQNPSDADATYDGHKGKGYQAQVAETYTRGNATDQRQMNLITYIETEAAHQSDAHAVLPYIEETEKRGICPVEALADSLYGSDHNCEQALQREVELVAPTMGTVKDGEITLADFSLSETNAVTACPAGHAPERMKIKNGRCSAMFSSDHCSTCPNKESCPVTHGKKGFFLRYDSKTARLARRRAREKTEAFREKYRYRSGIEATMSEFDRRTGVKHLRVRGMKAVRFCVFLKATGLNILRAAAFLAANNKKPEKQKDKKSGGYFCLVYVVVKEHVAAAFRQLGEFPEYIFQNGSADDRQPLRLVA
jgi:hypothetical protein